MSTEGARVWKVGEGELTNPPMLSSLCSLSIDAEYVFFFFFEINVLLFLFFLKSSFPYL